MKPMKDSGTAWFGKIPNNWQLIKAKYIFAQRSEQGNNVNLQLLSPTQKFGVIPQSKYEELTGMNAVKLNQNVNLALLKTIHKGAFCISLRSFQGGFEYSKYEGVVSPAYQVFYPTVKIADGYYKYLFKDQSFIDKMNSYTISLRDGKNISFEDFGNTFIPFPPPEQQQQIADYLDKKCAEVDGLSSNIQKQIEVLEQYKRAVITETVTKGLNPSVPMKDSGIPWIGHIPQYWNTIKVKFIAHFINGYAFDSETLTTDGENTVIRIGDIAGGSIEPETALKYSGPEMGLVPYQVLKHDILVALSGATVGKTGYIKEDYPNTFINQRVGIIRSVYSRFLNYALQTSSFIPFALLHAAASAQPNISLNTIGNYTIAFPHKKEEQQAIADYLDDKCSKIDAIIQDKQQQLKKLEQYKKAIIFEYVTGKKQVPEVI